MSVHRQRVQFFYSSLDTTIFSAHITCAIITLPRICSRLSPSWDSWMRIVDAKSLPVLEETGTKYKNSSCTVVSLINRTDEQSCSLWLASVVSSASIEKYLHWEISESICFCMASPITDMISFCTLQLKYEALRGAFKKRSDVCLSAASTRSVKAALKTPSLQSVLFSGNAPASLRPLNGISLRPQNSIVLMVWESRFRFSSTVFCRLLLKAFRTSLDLTASVWTNLSNMAAHNYDSDSFGDYCNVLLPFYNCSVVPKLMSREVLRYDWQSEAGAQPALHFGWGNFHELSFDDVIVLIQPCYNFFANGHRCVLFATFPKMRTY